MADAGLFSLTGIIAGALGAVMTGPAGQVNVPDRTFPAGFSSPPGYEITLADAEGQPLGAWRSPGPVRVDLDALPKEFVGAVMAAEDRRFTEHPGIDPVGTALAAADTLRGRLRGGSGLTQQMVKNTVVGNGLTSDRKIAEAVIAIRAQNRLGEREVLRLYLESAWFGRGERGVMQAARLWFGKDWSEVTLGEQAYLAALLKGPALYDGWRHPERALERRDWVIGRMEENGWISAEAADAARAEPLAVLPPDRTATGAKLDRWATSAVAWQMARDRLQASGPELEARLTIDPRWQALAEEALAASLARFPGQEPLGHVAAAEVRAADPQRPDGGTGGQALLRPMQSLLPPGSPYRPAVLMDRDDGGWIALTSSPRGLPERVALPLSAFPAHARPEAGDVVAVGRDPADTEVRMRPAAEGAVVILDPRTGAILASVGGVDPDLSAFDRTRARRQPGSSAKTFLWLAALEQGIRYDTLVPDLEQDWRMADGTVWHPRNYDGSQAGMIPLYRALEHSSNLVAASLVNLIGPEAMAAMAEAAGAWPAGGMARRASSALGTSETSLLELTSGYAAIVNDAIPRAPYVIDRLSPPGGPATIDRAAGIVPGGYQRSRPIVSSGTMNDVLSMLWGVTHRGTAANAFARSSVAIAGKTGTSQDYRDAWFLGVTPHLAIGVWIGRDDNRPLPRGSTGGTVAAPAAARLLAKAHAEGLIGADGLRDGLLTSSVSWPPQLLASSGGAPVIPATDDGWTDDTPVSEEEVPMAEAEAPVAGGTFWGIVDDRRPRRQDPEPTAAPVAASSETPGEPDPGAPSFGPLW
ncbi:transglycosylase domain-containing protein [Cereibacter sphaeroides]|uniref:transglycosylase domain-containing protein n=1 Tax=Cereibacter sphaeroides TaxID=1063 RepID=UPI001F30914F|nr:transglycosylase domain-containing protein [Cereibacter sphaeroides]MCE6959663.1 transglycosylase domain-containing protein [Cereibacter sphaeroides]MCE6974476.1 transglycosylase domain-containing protein [Cereibacter sphaeroides]